MCTDGLANVGLGSLEGEYVDYTTYICVYIVCMTYVCTYIHACIHTYIRTYLLAYIPHT